MKKKESEDTLEWFQISSLVSHDPRGRFPAREIEMEGKKKENARNENLGLLLRNAQPRERAWCVLEMACG